MPITVGRVPSSTASQKTLHRRTQWLESAREVMSSGTSVEQMEADVKGLPKEARQQILKEAGLPIEIPTSHGLAIKANLQLSWKMMRTIRR